MSARSDLERHLGYVFADGALLDMALTHASLHKKSYDNERLEFLGDRVLGLIAAAMLYKGFPDDTEGALAKRQTALVQRSALAAVADTLHLDEWVRLSGGRLEAGSRQRETVLADAMEALIGAVFLDGGFDAAEKVVTAHWAPLLRGQDLPPEDPKTGLQEWAQERGMEKPRYTLIARGGSDHAPVFEIEVSLDGFAPVRASGANKKITEKEAARLLFEKIKKGDI